MGRRKSNKKKIEEGRCTGIGPTYVPFHKSYETPSRASSPITPDRREGRMVHCLSTTEDMLYTLLHWNPNVLHIREQYQCNIEIINQLREKCGYKNKLPLTASFTTDFLVDFVDGTQRAYSVKYKKYYFDPSSKMYQGRPDAYCKLIRRQCLEIAYWASQGVEFHIVTRDDLMEHRIKIKNIDFVMGFWDESLIVNTDQMLLYLIAHRIIEVPMDKEFINPRQLVASMNIDIETVYKRCIDLRKELGLIEN